jgi:hypothetical protein
MQKNASANRRVKALKALLFIKARMKLSESSTQAAKSAATPCLTTPVSMHINFSRHSG